MSTETAFFQVYFWTKPDCLKDEVEEEEVEEEVEEEKKKKEEEEEEKTITLRCSSFIYAPLRFPCLKQPLYPQVISGHAHSSVLFFTLL